MNGQSWLFGIVVFAFFWMLYIVAVNQFPESKCEDSIQQVCE